MSSLQFTFLLGMFVILIPTIKCDLLAVKCCARKEELSADLTTCQPLSAATKPKSVNSQSITSSNTTFDVDNGFQYKTQDVDEELSWLPQHLKEAVRGDSTVDIGSRNRCSNSRTIRLKVPTDEGRFNWLSNGSLILRSLRVNGNFSENTYTPQDFCADTYTDKNGTQQHAILLCPCDKVRCLKKCCPPGQALVCYPCRCKPYDSPWSPFHPDLPLPERDFSYEIVVDQNVTCGAEYKVYSNMFVGRPPYMVQRFWKRYWNEFNMCTDIIVGMLAKPEYGMKRCMRPPPFEIVLDNWLHIPEAVLLGLAIATLIIVPHEKISSYSHVNYLSLLKHAACLLVRSLLYTVYLKVWYACYVTPIFVYFFSVGANLWINVMCINMACGFWKPPVRQPVLQPGRNRGYKPMFLWYSLYAWGVTTAMTGFSAFMWYSLKAPSSLLRPTLFETKTCFIEEEGDGKMATFAYYYGPIAWLLLLNALLFVATAVKVRHLSKNKNMLKSENSKATKGSFSNKWSMVIYITIQWVMGVLEMVTWLSNNHIYYTALAVTCLDVLRAIAIFVFCCCNGRTLGVLRKRFCACANAIKSSAARA